MKLLIIEPWFCAIGHPAQSLLNLASAIGRDERVDYLVSSSSDYRFFQDSMEQLRMWSNVESYTVTTPVGDTNTVRALLALGYMRLKGRQYQRILFFDESLYVLALLWPFFSLFLPVERLGVLHLYGPNLGKGPRSRWVRFVIGRFLRRPEVRFYLRTAELAQAWLDAYKDAAGQIRIRTLPSLEIPDDPAYHRPPEPADGVRFGIVGQIRTGKGIEWLVPAFQNDTSLGRLTVAGEFNIPQAREQLSVLLEFKGFINCYMTESDMLARAAEQDYLLMLYDVWDRRMESAVLYLAARVNRPVIVYDDGWCGRMVREFGCGMVASGDHEKVVNMLRLIPRPGSAEYAKMLKGMDAFRQAHSVKSLRNRVMQELFS